MAQNIVQAEYFIDADNGYGNNTAITLDSIVTDGIFQFNVDLNGISAGIHKLYVRVRDENNVWSLNNSRTFIVTPVTIDSNIVYGEYFFDIDPGIGSGTSIGSVASKDDSVSFTADLTGLASGIHKMYVRVKDSENAWSFLNSRTIVIEDADTADITGVEYFFDTDPGYGNGNFVAATPASQDATIAFTANLSSLTSGIHKMYIRALDSKGKWSLLSTKNVMVVEYQESNIVELEYFFDEDPGYGNGFLIPVTPSTDATIAFQADFNGLKPGIHKMYVRARDENGKRSLLNTRVIQVIEPKISPIVRLEYYFSNATDSAQTTDTYIYDLPTPGTDVTITFPAELSQLIEDQSYRINIWAIDSLGQKSIVNNYLTTYDADYCEAGFDLVIDEQNGNVQFTDTSINSSAGIYWEFGDGEFSDKHNPLHVYPTGGEYDVCLSIFNSGTKCFSKACTTVVIGEIDTTNCYAGFTYNVNNLTVSFTENFSDDITDNFWDFGDGSSTTTLNPMRTYESPGEYEVCANVVNTTTGCQSQICKKITVGDLDCYADFNYLVDRSNKKVDVINTSLGNINQWYWTFGDGTSLFTESGSKTYDKYGAYEVCLSALNSGADCYSKKCKTIEIKDTVSGTLCNAKFTYVVSDLTREVSFKENSLSVFDKWYWDFGDGNNSNDQSTSNTYSRDGVYKVCLVATNEGSNCKSELCKNILVTENSGSTSTLLKADFGYVANSTGFGVLFKDLSKGDATNWYWTFGDGTFKKGQNPGIHSYSKAGTYKVCLTVYDSITNNSSELCKEIVVGTVDCNISAEFSNFIDISKKEVKFNDLSKGKVNKWAWDFGDGKTSSASNPKHTYLKEGFYLVSLSVWDTINDCVDYFAEFIQVGTVDCKADFEYVVDADSLKVSFKDISKGNTAKRYWSFDDGEYSTDPNPKHTYKKAGIYLVTLTIVDGSGTCSDFIRTQIQVGNVDCSAGFTASVDSGSYSAYFQKDVLGSVTSNFWTFGNGGVSRKENPVHKYSFPGYYTVALNTYYEGVNCIDYHEENVLIGESGSDCEANFYFTIANKTVDFVDKSFGESLTYKWYFGDGNTSTEKNPSHPYINGRYYNVCLTVKNSHGIENTTCKFIRVAPETSTNCLAKFNFAVDSSTRNVTFTNTSLGNPDEFNWRFGDGMTSTNENPEHLYSSSGYYLVRLGIRNSANNCRSRTFALIPVSTSNETYIKAGFGYEIDSSNTKGSGEPVDFIGVATGKPAKYEWDFGDGSDPVTGTSNPTHEYTQEGTFEACLIISDPVTGQSDETCENITIKLDDNTVGVNTISGVTENMKVYPNPFVEYTTISYELTEQTRLTINVYDANGKKIETVISTNKQPGSHNFVWNTEKLQAGIYLMEFVDGNENMKTIMLVKR